MIRLFVFRRKLCFCVPWIITGTTRRLQAWRFPPNVAAACLNVLKIYKKSFCYVQTPLDDARVSHVYQDSAGTVKYHTKCPDVLDKGSSCATGAAETGAQLSSKVKADARCCCILLRCTLNLFSKIWKMRTWNQEKTKARTHHTGSQKAQATGSAHRWVLSLSLRSDW